MDALELYTPLLVSASHILSNGLVLIRCSYSCVYSRLSYPWPFWYVSDMHTHAISFLILHYIFLAAGLARSLTEPEVQAVFTNASLLSTLAAVLEKGAKNADADKKDEEGGGEDVRFVIYDGQADDEVRLFFFALIAALLSKSSGSHPL